MAVQEKFQESLETISTHLEDAMMNEAVYQTLKIAGEFFSHTGGVNVESVDMASLDLQAAFDNVREITAAIGQELNSGGDPTDEDELERELDEMLRAEQAADKEMAVASKHSSPTPEVDVLSQRTCVLCDKKWCRISCKNRSYTKQFPRCRPWLRRLVPRLRQKRTS